MGIDGGPTEDERARAQEFYDALSKRMRLSRLDDLLASTSEIVYSAIAEDCGGLPTVGSQMAADIDELGTEVVANVQRVCGTWHVVAAEQLQAVASVHAGGHLLFAAGPLLRSVMEHTARIGWVLDGDTATRSARSWLAEVASNGEDRDTHENRGDPSASLAGAAARLEELDERTVPSLFGGERPDCRSRRISEWSLLSGRQRRPSLPRGLPPGR